MSGLEIRQIPVLNDNYVYLIHDGSSGKTACVDPAVAPPVIDAARAAGWTISHILVTHPHHDHIGGIDEIVATYGAEVYGSKDDQANIPHCRHGVAQGDSVQVGASEAKVLDVPGHTAHHIAYLFESAEAVFVGDTLFSLGCGRLLGGTAQQMWGSLQKLRTLPPATKVYCAHEYTNANADFALSVDPDNMDLQDRADAVLRMRQQGLPSVPSTLEEELKCNPFLRCDRPEFKAIVGMSDRDAADVFAEIRQRKDHF